MNDIEKTIKELAGQIALSTQKATVKQLKEAITESVNGQNEEFIATYVEGTKRTIKSLDKQGEAVSKALKNVSDDFIDLSNSLNSVEKAVKGIKVNIPKTEIPKTDLGMVEETLKGIYDFTKSPVWPSKGKDAIPVRIWDGKKFIDDFGRSMGTVLQSAGGGRGPSMRAITEQRDAVPVVTPSGASMQSGLIDEPYDYIAVTYPVNTTEVYTFKQGGSGGTTQATVTVVYTDSTKESLSTVTKI